MGFSVELRTLVGLSRGGRGSWLSSAKDSQEVLPYEGSADRRPDKEDRD